MVKFVEKIKTYIVHSIIFFRTSCRLSDNEEIFCRAGQTTADNNANVHC